jgi:hypothetical protein
MLPLKVYLLPAQEMKRLRVNNSFRIAHTEHVRRPRSRGLSFLVHGLNKKSPQLREEDLLGV